MRWSKCNRTLILSLSGICDGRLSLSNIKGQRRVPSRPSLLKKEADLSNPVTMVTWRSFSSREDSGQSAVLILFDLGLRTVNPMSFRCPGNQRTLSRLQLSSRFAHRLLFIVARQLVQFLAFFQRMWPPTTPSVIRDAKKQVVTRYFVVVVIIIIIIIISLSSSFNYRKTQAVIETSHGSVSVFCVGIGFRFFGRFL